MMKEFAEGDRVVTVKPHTLKTGADPVRAPGGGPWVCVGSRGTITEIVGSEALVKFDADTRYVHRLPVDDSPLFILLDCLVPLTPLPRFSDLEEVDEWLRSSL